jgi:hypothetical protein
MQCYCVHSCGGPDGPGKPVSYTTYRRHLKKSYSTSPEFNNFLQNRFPIVGASTSTMPPPPRQMASLVRELIVF